MPLKRSSGEPRLGWGEVFFPMEDATTGRRVECQVDKWALENMGFKDEDDRPFLDPRPDFLERHFPGYIQIFLMFREQIEDVASREYDRGERPPIVHRFIAPAHSKSPS